ncbi:MAG: ATP-binding protein [Spirochaetia bacterium]|nr:ATP-binding protein [Spirochaetia bacterium]
MKKYFNRRLFSYIILLLITIFAACINQNQDFETANLMPSLFSFFAGCLLVTMLFIFRDRNQKRKHDYAGKYALHLQSTPLGVIEWDIDFKVKQWNHSAEIIFGYTKEEALNRHPSEIIVPEEASEYVNEVWRELLKNKGGDRSTNENIRKDGQKILCDWYNTPLIDKRGAIIGVLSIIQDITDTKELIKMVEKLLNEAERANKARSSFIANVSHEIRTPLNAIMGFADVLSEHIADMNQKSYLNSIQLAGNSLLELINDILDLSRIEAGALLIQKKIVNLREMLEEIQRVYSEKSLKKNIHFILDIDAKLPDTLIVDKIRLRQILVNLIGNAIKFTDIGHIKLSVFLEDINNREKEVDLRISVEDTGIGIPEEDQKVIFEAFSKKRNQDPAYSGTGLGLNIVKKIAIMMGGEVFLTSEVGEGSKFDVILKNIKVADKNYPDKSEFEDDQIQLSDLGNLKVLITDDTPLNRLLIRKFLEHPNIEFEEAFDGMVAYETALKAKPDIILMDLRMPGTDGYEAIKMLRDNQQTKKIPIIVITASTIGNVKNKVSHDCEGYLMKPVERKELISEIHRIMSKKQSNSNTGILK